MESIFDCEACCGRKSSATINTKPKGTPNSKTRAALKENERRVDYMAVGKPPRDSGVPDPLAQCAAHILTAVLKVDQVNKSLSTVFDERRLVRTGSPRVCDHVFSKAHVQEFLIKLIPDRFTPAHLVHAVVLFRRSFRGIAVGDVDHSWRLCVFFHVHCGGPADSRAPHRLLLTCFMVRRC